MLLNLEKSVGSRKATQSIDAPSKSEKSLITSKVTTSFSDSLDTPMAYASFSRPTNFFRLNTLSERLDYSLFFTIFRPPYTIR